MAVATGKTINDDRVADLRLGVEGRVPKDYIPEPEMRINLAARIAGARDAAALDLLVGEVEDRFGPLPDALRLSFDLARLRNACRRLGIHRLDAGPKAIAASFDLARAEALAQATDLSKHSTMSWSKNRLIDTEIAASGAEPVGAAMAMIETVERLLRRKTLARKPGTRRTAKKQAA